LNRALSIIGICFLLGSCGWLSGNKGKSRDALAKVGDKYLYASDIEGLVQPGTSVKDSISKVNSFVEQWIKTQLLVQKAELNLSAERKDFEKEMENFKTTLLIHRYQEKIVEQLLDTMVTEADIQKYYKENQQQFVLRKNLVKSSYIIFSRNAKERDKIKGWMLSDKEEQQQKLQKFCKESAMSYQLADTSWQLMDELERLIPFDYSSQESFLARSKFYETQDSSMVYMVRFRDYKSKEGTSPIEFERPVIKSLIINIRKQEILRKMEEDIYKEAQEKKTFQNFVK
jgi:hypothetical protein